MQPNRPIKNVQTLIVCSNCHKQIPVSNYRIHVWYCAKTQQINPTIQRIFKSQIKMSQNLRSLIRQDQEESIDEKFPCMHCGFEMGFADFDSHPMLCPQLPVLCPYCEIQFPKGLIQEHDLICEGGRNKLLLTNIELQVKKSSSKNLDEPTVDEHMDFVVREIANLFGVRKPQALSNQQLINLPLETFKKTGEQQQCCAICYIDFQNYQKLVKLKCGHMFHRRCMCNWFSVANTCPTCRFEIEKREME